MTIPRCAATPRAKISANWRSLNSAVFGSSKTYRSALAACINSAGSCAARNPKLGDFRSSCESFPKILSAAYGPSIDSRPCDTHLRSQQSHSVHDRGCVRWGGGAPPELLLGASDLRNASRVETAGRIRVLSTVCGTPHFSNLQHRRGRHLERSLCMDQSFWCTCKVASRQ